MHWYFRNGITINTALSVLIYGGLLFFYVPAIRIFNQELELVQTTAAVLPRFSLSFIPTSLNLIFTAFLFSTKRTGAANVIAINRGIVIKALAVFLLPVLFGTEIIWIAPLEAEIITLILAVILNRQCKLRYQ